MAAQESATAHAGPVEVVLGDLFLGRDDVVVIPCSTSGSIAPDFSTRLVDYTLDMPRRLEPGQVVRAWEADGKVKRRPGPTTILLAAVVVDGVGSKAEWVRSAAARAARLASDRGGTLGLPLLGSGAGVLEAEESFNAIVAGVTRQDTPPAVYSAPSLPVKIYVRDQAQYDQLSNQYLTWSLEDVSESAGEEDKAPAPSWPVETVPTHTDGPAVVDELGRQGFAKVLARRIRDARTEETRNSKHAPDPQARRGGAFILHLHAPWGAGKTSVLNFLAAELRKDDPAADAKRSVVVDFNAWRHQRIEPPWWWLMRALYSGAVRELDTFDRRRALTVRIREWIWRSKGGWPGYLALVLVAGLVFLAWRAGWFGGAGNQELFSPATFKGFVVTAAAIITPALTVWGLLHAMGRWVFSTSARGARRFIANTSDPMRVVQEHLADLTQWIHHDIVVMIDDLDRCKSPYVVELLEGIQTLFREIPVTYVVAADRDWLADSYASEYATFGSLAGEPGRPVGYLFLEKTFQISTGLPQVRDRIDAFWGRILRSPSVPGEADLEAARTAAASELGSLPPDDVRREVARNQGSSVAEVQARRELVAVEMVSERARVADTHTLEPFRALLGDDPNPRMMKRLVNAYGIARGIETLQGVNLDNDETHEQQTALWTILTLRWPKLGAYLARCPERLIDIGSDEPKPGIPSDLLPLFTEPDVIAVVKGNAANVKTSLTVNGIRFIALR
ncbi:KAP-like P-loop domain-containing protein [Kribbella steppae]|uniref:KAP-like P-loop domain-containing protein n=1 Tax=Kribbella steppae TaxID=2512223 RepID=A0A4V2S1A1_9ACTN|nr:P-loop NTPase fold protein [Kribbella steppae]TCO35880.1 KAP-like P-loop domain-containing protein [Kribbella steppae]